MPFILLTRSWFLVFADTPLDTETSAADDPFGLRSLRVLGLREDAFPDEDAWKSLSDFFAQHQPVSQEVGGKSSVGQYSCATRPFTDKRNNRTAMQYNTIFVLPYRQQFRVQDGKHE